MLAQIKKPVMTALSVLLFSFVVLSYQNCAKPLDEIGMSSSLSSSSTCNISASPETIYLSGGPATISFSFVNDISYKIRVILMQNATGLFTESIHTQGGSVTASYANADQTGTYTAHGIVEDASGATVGRCQDTYQVSDSSGEDPPSQSTYSWQSGGWGACSVTACGQTGSQIRAVSCVRSDNAVVAESYCANAGAKPSTSQSCSTAPCGTNYTYSWDIGAWSACSVTACGQNGTQSRTVVCKRNDGVISADANCGTKPVVTQNCSGACSSCTLNGSTVAHGASKTFYTTTNVTCANTCAAVAQSRTCNNGVLSGSASYSYATCSRPAGCGGGGIPCKIGDTCIPY